MDNTAVLDGYTIEVTATCSEHELYLLIKPDTDLTGTFKAWDTDNQEYIRVNGWLYSLDVSQEQVNGPVSVGRTDCTGEVKRFATIKQAEDYIAHDLIKVDPVGVEAGDYYIDAPELMVNPPR